MIKLGGWFAATVLAVFCATSTAQAVVVCVQPQGGICQGDLRSAIFDTAFGDTVRIRPGVYTDTVQLPPLKAGVRLIGSAGVIIDARSDGVAQSQPPTNLPANPANNPFPPKVTLNQDYGIHVYADDTQLVGLTVLGGISHGIFVEPGSVRTRMVKIRVINPMGVGINAPLSDGTTLIDVKVEGALGGVAMVGADLVVDRLAVKGSDGPGLSLTGDGISVTKTKISRVVNGQGIFITGNDAYLDRPIVDSVDSTGIEVVGNDATVLGARVTSTGGGISVTGDSPWVSKSRVEQISGGNPGIAVTCSTCTNGSVDNNRVEGTTGDSAGYTLLATGAGLLAEKNRAKDIGDIGFDLTGSTGITLVNNRADDVGAATEDCYVINGTDNTVAGNRASGCARNGFSVTGANNALQDNTANASGGDGIEVGIGAVGTVLTSNRALSNARHGIEIADDGFVPATNTVLDSNRAKLNVIADVCREGVGTTVIGKNKFGSELTPLQDGIRDCAQ